jgi:hypothetical protein
VSATLVSSRASRRGLSASRHGLSASRHDLSASRRDLSALTPQTSAPRLPNPSIRRRPCTSWCPPRRPLRVAPSASPSPRRPLSVAPSVSPLDNLLRSTAWPEHAPARAWPLLVNVPTRLRARRDVLKASRRPGPAARRLYDSERRGRGATRRLRPVRRRTAQCGWEGRRGRAAAPEPRGRLQRPNQGVASSA